MQHLRSVALVSFVDPTVVLLPVLLPVVRIVAVDSKVPLAVPL